MFLIDVRIYGKSFDSVIQSLLISKNEQHNNWFPKYSMYVFNGFHKGFKWVSLLLWSSCNVLFFWVEEKNGMWYFGNQKIGLLMT